MRKHKPGRHALYLNLVERPYTDADVRDVLAALGPAVYAVRARDGLIKIGFTTNLRDRLAQVSCWSRVLGFRLGATYADEQDIHRSLAGHAARGREWYPPDDPEVLAVVNSMRTDLGLEPIAA